MIPTSHQSDLERIETVKINKQWKEHCSKTLYAYSAFFVFQIEESFENFYNEENSFQGVKINYMKTKYSFHRCYRLDFCRDKDFSNESGIKE
jgi:hypothetical protein